MHARVCTDVFSRCESETRPCSSGELTLPSLLLSGTGRGPPHGQRSLKTDRLGEQIQKVKGRLLWAYMWLTTFTTALHLSFISLRLPDRSNKTRNKALVAEGTKPPHSCRSLPVYGRFAGWQCPARGGFPQDVQVAGGRFASSCSDDPHADSQSAQ